MDNNNQNDGFFYTYSAKEQAEIQRIREKYQSPAPSAEDPMTQLRRLDAGVTRTAQVVALTLGVLGVLIMGFGMSLCMSELPAMLELSAKTALPLGIVMGIVGGVVVCAAYPVHNAIIRYKRKKLAPEILRLTDRLLR